MRVATGTIGDMITVKSGEPARHGEVPQLSFLQVELLDFLLSECLAL